MILNIKKINKLSLLLVFVTTIFLSLVFINNNKHNLLSSIVQKLATSEEVKEEVELDNWEISTVFYDSIVDNGNTPLTEINWDASDGGYNALTPRVITVQINYKNTNAVTTYQPGEIKISIPNLIYYNSSDSTSMYNANLNTSVLVGANDTTHTGYDWDFLPYQYKTSSTSSLQTAYVANKYGKTYTFTNANVIEEKSNFEGSIQIIYTITPLSCTGLHTKDYSEKCIHEYHLSMEATLNETIKSNKMTFDYTRTYIHPWQYGDYTIKKSTGKLTSYDGLPENAKDYYWVTYYFRISGPSSSYPYIGVSKHRVIDTLPEGCVVLDYNFNEIHPEENNTYIFDNFSSSTTNYIYVGYPKSSYNKDNNNLTITNHVDLYSKYLDSEEFSFMDDDEVSINLANFEFTYSGNLYSISKITGSDTIISEYLYYQTLTRENTNIGKTYEAYVINPRAIYTGGKMDVKFGDDILYMTTIEGGYRQLEDNEYYFSKIAFPNIKNANDKNILNKYNVELWTRKENESEYKLYTSFSNQQKSFVFSENSKIVGYYFIIKEVKESIIASGNVSHVFPERASRVSFKRLTNIPESGQICNFAYLQVYVDGILQNEPTIDSYNSFVTKEEIAKYDMETYGKYMQRSAALINYRYFKINDIHHTLNVVKKQTSFTQNASEEKFTGTATISLQEKSTGAYQAAHYATGNLNEDNLIKGYEIYDLLPLGMELNSDSEDILNSFYIRNNSGILLFYKNGKQLSSSEFIKIIKEVAEINIIHNWKDTGRTYISVIIKFKEPIQVACPQQYNDKVFLEFNYKYSVSYDSYLEYGSVWKNSVYANYYQQPINNYFKLHNPLNDEYDLNEDGSTKDKLSKASVSSTITSVISTHQDVTTYVQTDQSNYSTDTVNTSNNSEYTYKLRVRSGANAITNLVIYDSIEKNAKDSQGNIVTAYGSKQHWNGEFIGIDKTYAESKGYKIKVYYSENEKVGTLSEDKSWKEYSESIDKRQVKSLAFEYLDSDGNKAVLPANSLTYVLIKMKSPIEKDIKTLAYNGCWTEWNAIDQGTGKPVSFITGINSNIVKVSLPNSVIPENIEIKVEKNWKDNNNKLGLRPETITYRLIANDDYSNATEIILSNSDVDQEDENHWSKTIEVEKYDDSGNIIEYSLKEDAIKLSDNFKYVPEINDYIVTNTLTKELIITKKWIDNNNQYLTRPSNVTIKILQNGTEYKEIKVTGDYSSNIWSNTITVPVYDENNKEYTYTLEEIDVKDYISTYDNNFTFTNILSGEEKLVIKKEWKDNSNKYNTRPENIIINILQNNKEYKSITLTGENDNWTSEEIIVPKYDSQGVKNIYTIEENQLSSYGLVTYDQNNLKVTNSLKQNMEIVVTKNWIDDNNAYNTRPNNLTITLLQNDKEYKTIILSGTTNSWKNSIEVPKYDENQIEYKYTIKEKNENILTEYADVVYSDDGLSVTNKLKKNINLTITKKWNDYDNKYLTRPEVIKINLLQNGNFYKEVEVKGEGNIWELEVTNLPAYNEDGIKYLYTIEEIEDEKLQRYSIKTYDQTQLIVTNELTIQPKVTLYFTVKNGYTEPGSDIVKFDEEGYKDVLKKYNLNHEDEYIYKFELQNTETGEIFEGKLSTQGILEFDDIPYGTYRALESEDEYFDFVSMLGIEEVLGVSFTPDSMGGTITIEPTGKDIIYGVNVINKINIPVKNPETKSDIIPTLSLLFLSIIVGIMSLFTYNKKNI